MANYYVPLPAARAPSNAMLDFRPLQNAITGIHQRNRQADIDEQNAMARQEASQRADASLGMQQERLGLAKKQFAQNQQDRTVQKIAGVAQIIDQDTDEASRSQKWMQLVTSRPEIAKALQDNGYDPNDYMAGPKALIAEARGYQDPLDRRLKQAQVQKAEMGPAPIVKEVNGRLVSVYPDGRAEEVYAPSGDSATTADMESRFGKVPSGYRWNAQGQLEAIPGGPATKLSGEAAAKVGMMRASRATLPQVRDIFLGEKGSTGKRKGGQDNAIGYWGEIGITGEGVRLIRGGVETVLRAASGAAVPETEVERYENLFVPKPYDTQITRKRKLDAFERWMSNIELAVNQGRFISQDDARALAEGATRGLEGGGDSEQASKSDPLGIR